MRRAERRAGDDQRLRGADERREHAGRSPAIGRGRRSDAVCASSTATRCARSTVAALSAAGDRDVHLSTDSCSGRRQPDIECRPRRSDQDCQRHGREAAPRPCTGRPRLRARHRDVCRRRARNAQRSRRADPGAGKSPSGNEPRQPRRSSPKSSSNASATSSPIRRAAGKPISSSSARTADAARDAW